MNIHAKKSLGQNFLIDENVLQKIANVVSVSSEDLIIEIGPGTGALTKYLVQKGTYFLAFEIDERMKQVLEKYQVKIIYGDFLKQNLKENVKNIPYRNLYVIANIPYYITTPIIEHLIYSDLSIQSIVLLVQKEVANRFSAKPGSKEYGYFTVFLNYYFDIEKLFDVSKTAFHPMPNVDSSVVWLKKKNYNASISDEYFMFLKNCFKNKRKTLKNNLKGYDWNCIFSVLNQYHYSENVRAEEIEDKIFLEIFNHLNI